MKIPKHIILSRTDNIGDVILSLPVAGYLKKVYPTVKISFIGKAYTQSIIECCEHIDEFIDREKILSGTISILADYVVYLYPDKELARKLAGENIMYRIGTANRWFHWLYCNKKVAFSRKKSSLHEAQLNFKLLKPIGIDYIPSLEEMPSYYGFKRIKPYTNQAEHTSKFKVILHPKSNGSAQEWSASNYFELAQLLTQSGISVYITGTSKEGQILYAHESRFAQLPLFTDMTGKLTLLELIAFINQSDALVACSTGPLHIAAALGINTFGIYVNRKPIHPGRWAAIGGNVKIITPDTSLANIDSIKPNKVFECICKQLDMI